MENKTCALCGGDIPEGDFCKTCFLFLREKYPEKRKLRKILQWHKNHTKKLNEEE